MQSLDDDGQIDSDNEIESTQFQTLATDDKSIVSCQSELNDSNGRLTCFIKKNLNLDFRAVDR